jgi:hypothetical protein
MTAPASRVALEGAKETVLSTKFWPDATNCARHATAVAIKGFGDSAGHSWMQLVSALELVDQARNLPKTAKAFTIAYRSRDRLREMELGLRVLAILAGLTANALLLTYVIGERCGNRHLKDVLQPYFKGFWTAFLVMGLSSRLLALHRTHSLVNEVGQALAPGRVPMALLLDTQGNGNLSRVEAMLAGVRQVTIVQDLSMTLTGDGWAIIKARMQSLREVMSGDLPWDDHHPSRARIARVAISHLHTRLKQNRVATILRCLAIAAAIGGQWWVGAPGENRYWLIAATGTLAGVHIWQSCILGKDKADTAAANAVIGARQAAEVVGGADDSDTEAA